MNKSESLALSALLASAAILMGYIESLLPVIPPIAGIKLGISNIVILLSIKIFENNIYSFGIMLVKALVCAALFAGASTLPYSLAGGIVSVFVMVLLNNVSANRLSAVGVSSAGGAAHMTAQLAVAAFLTSTPAVMSLLPLLLAVGTVTGLINGIIVNLIASRLIGGLSRKMKL